MFFKEFRDLRRKRDRRQGLPDLLNYAFAEDDYTIVMKDGARLVAFECHAPDLNSASPKTGRPTPIFRHVRPNICSRYRVRLRACDQPSEFSPRPRTYEEQGAYPLGRPRRRSPMILR